MAILVRSTFTVTANGRRHVGSSCANPTVKRVLVWADVQLPGGDLRVYGTHLTAGDSGPLTVLDAFVPNRTDADWAVPGAAWFRLSDHLRYIVDLGVAAFSAKDR